jgi:predicted ATPase with chaperone activity
MMRTPQTATTTAPAAVAHSADLSTLAPRPTTPEETGLGAFFIEELILKQLLESGVLDLLELINRLCLAGSVLEHGLAHLREEGQIEVRGQSGASNVLRYALTDRGRVSATEAMVRDGYVGPAPVPLATFTKLVELQSVRHCHLSREQVQTAFADTVIRQSLLDQLGPAMHSGRAMFVYGDAGTGKSFISRRLARLLGSPVLVPHALEVNNSVIQFYDPSYHHTIAGQQQTQATSFRRGHDPRFVLCERPLVVTGGELTLDMLELQFDGVTRRYRAPLQLLATNGMMLIDDLGRQRVQPVDLFNRWIIPLEDRHDYLSLKNGQHICLPFDVMLAFSTNLNPLDLADEAFLRRIGYKIHFPTLSVAEFSAIWRQVCGDRGVAFQQAPLDFLLHDLFAKESRPLLPCHPRDFIDLAQDYNRYQGETGISEQALRWAWENYFVSLADTKETTP